MLICCIVVVNVWLLKFYDEGEKQNANWNCKQPVLKYSCGNSCPLEKAGMPMGYVTYDNLIQVELFVIALIGLVYRISHKDKK